MTPSRCSAFLVLLTAAGLAGADVKHVVFDSHAKTREKFATEYVPTLMHDWPVSEHKWALKELNPELPADWSSFKFLVMEVKASTAQRFLLRLYTADGMRALRFHQFGGGVWIRAAVPLAYFQSQSQEGQDLAAVFNKSRNPFWMAVVGPFGSINAVESLAVAMVAPVGNPTLDIRNVHLSNDDPGSEVIDKLPVVDEFGQWIPAEYAGKAKSLEQLKSDWDREDKSLHSGEFGYCKYGGFASTKAKATGFFRVEQINGKWWFVDPDGHLFLSMGVNGMGSTGGSTRVTGREKYFAGEPPADLPAGASGRRPGPGDFYGWNLARRYGAGWDTKANDMTLRRMEAWGLNTARSGLSKEKPAPYAAMLRAPQTAPVYMGMPDVYSEEFARAAESSAMSQLTPMKDDPYVLGYFIGNEPAWPGRESELTDMILKGKETETQRKLKAFLAGGDTPARRKEFVLAAFEHQLQVTNQAARKADPNHLNLGIRFGALPPDDVIRMGRFFDVYSHNIYEYAPDRAWVAKLYKLTGKPLLIGEFHFGTPTRGQAPALMQVANEKERGIAYRYYVEQVASMPSFVGAHWFAWLDEPVTGRMDGENYSFGFLDVTDRASDDFIQGVIAAHKRLLAVHSGKAAPFKQKAKVQ
ncbi:MAG: hypothetical protein WBQ65_05105 [Bryobacteraceae bacterium]